MFEFPKRVLAFHAHPDDTESFCSGTLALLKEKGFAVGNVDATVAAERPKLLPYEPAMRQNLARVLGILPERVSVKATTTEGLGIVGEGRGMAAQCVCTVF